MWGHLVLQFPCYECEQPCNLMNILISDHCTRSILGLLCQVTVLGSWELSVNKHGAYTLAFKEADTSVEPLK